MTHEQLLGMVWRLVLGCSLVLSAEAAFALQVAGSETAQSLCSSTASKRFKPSLAPRQSADPMARAIYTTEDRQELKRVMAGQDPNAPRQGSTIRPLALAAGAGNLEAMRQLTAMGAKRDEIDAHGESAISMAVIAGQDAAVCWLLRQGASLPAPGTKPYLLTMAATADDMAAARLLVALLLQSGYDWRGRAMGDTALHVAAERGDPVLLNTLLAAGADPLLRNDRQLTAIDVARSSGSSQALRILEAAKGRQRVR